MLYRWLLGVALLAGVSSPATAQTYPDIVEISDEARTAIASENVYQPTADWRLTSSNAGCSVRRNFVLGDERVTFVMRRLQPGLQVQYALFGTEFSEDEPIEAGFVPGIGLARHTRLAGASIGEREGFVYAGQPFPVEQGEDAANEPQLASATQFYVVQGEESDPIVLTTGAMDAPLRMLADCAVEGLINMGVELRGNGSFLRRASMLNPEEIDAHLSASYPGAARRDGQQGPVMTRVIIDPSGRVTHCHVASYLTARRLREAACEVLSEHGEFEPALNFSGQPTTDYHITNVIFYLRDNF